MWPLKTFEFETPGLGPRHMWELHVFEQMLEFFKHNLNLGKKKDIQLRTRKYNFPFKTIKTK